MKKIVFVVFLVTISTTIWFKAAPQLGAQINDTEMKKLEKSKHYKKGQFVNLEETEMMTGDESMFKIMREFMKKGENRTPEIPVPTQKFDATEFLNTNDGISIAWFGHSTVLMNIDGVIILTDPVFSKHASPFGFMGNKSFDFTNNYSIEDLPKIDVVLISHDHYDHLDLKTIKQIKDKTDKFIVPLGVAGHLKKWKVDENKIAELDWYENYSANSSIQFTSTPARHFSGRGLKRNLTQWCSYVIEINGKRVYFSGDSGYGNHFKEIGDKYGPFELTLLECGQYNKSWANIHMDPSETTLAHSDLKGKKLLPLHWAKFKLSLHEWTEPMDVLFTNANGVSDQIITPKIGSILQINEKTKTNFWWKK